MNYLWKKEDQLDDRILQETSVEFERVKVQRKAFGRLVKHIRVPALDDGRKGSPLSFALFLYKLLGQLNYMWNLTYFWRIADYPFRRWNTSCPWLSWTIRIPVSPLFDGLCCWEHFRRSKSINLVFITPGKFIIVDSFAGIQCGGAFLISFVFKGN